MFIKSATFSISTSDAKKCPPPVFPEYAFIGRSNVGKSSLINSITGKRGLAKTSSTPGKTKLINHFLINDNWYLVDLPGYGYARASKKAKEEFSGLITEYILDRKNLFYVFVLIDSRLELQKIDIEFMVWLGENNVPFVMALTKTDKLTNNAFNKNLAAIKKQLLNYWEELPPIFTSSALTGKGKDEILAFIGNTNLGFSKEFMETLKKGQTSNSLRK